MKILGIMGSSRRDGNTDDLLEIALKGVAEAGAEVDKVVLLDYEIRHILNCKACEEHGACVNDDDLMAVMEKIFAADVHIWASPLYWYTVRGLTKVLLDRFSCFLYLYPEAQFEERMKGKGAAIITVQEEEEPEKADHLLGCLKISFDFCMQVYLGYVLGPGGSRGTALQDEETVRQAYKLGQKAARFSPAYSEGGKGT